MYRNIIAIAFGIIFANLVCTNRVLSQDTIAEQNLIKINNIEIKGNTVFSDSELKKAYSPLKENLTLEQLFQIKERIKQYYLDRGYISSGAFLPQQNIESGNLIIEVVEGSLEAIEIEELSSLSEKYITKRLPRLKQPLRVRDLTEALRKLEEDPLIKEVSAELKVLKPGENLLILEIEENKAIQTQLNFVNTYSPTIGRLGGSANVTHQNFLGFGDRLSVNYLKTEGLDRYGAGYLIPFNTTGGRIAFDYSNADSELVEEAISAFDIQADFEGYKLLISQPVINNARQKLTLSFGFEKLKSETFVAEDISFAFVDGLENGVSRITPLRLGQEYTRRENNSLVTVNSQFNVGLDILDVTENENTGIDALFWSWQGNVQWIRAFDKEGDWQFRTNLFTQLTPDKLLPLEQLTVGGLGSVRGYRQNLIVGDNGIVLIVEGQLPLIRTQKWGNIYLVPFADFGTIWSNYSNPDNNQTDTLVSLGLELNYRFDEFLNTRIFYGIPLSDTEDFGDSSVEERWGFSISLIPLRF